MFAIGKAAALSGMPKKTVRYYNDIGLVKASQISEKGYRLYDERDVRKLTFVKHARSFGFNIETCRELLDLYVNPERTSKEVKAIAMARLSEIEDKMNALKQLHHALSHLANHCQGDQKPDCPIIDYLAKA